MPAASIARTETLPAWAGSARGAAHADHAPASIRHSKRPGSLLANTARPSPPPGGVAIARAAVSGGVRSMVHANDDGSVSVWPKRSVARTRST